MPTLAPTRPSALAPLLLLAILTAPCTAQDCNNNGTPDADEVTFSYDSGVLTTIGTGNPQAATLIQPPPASGPVTITLQAFGDFDADGFEYLDVNLNGTNIARAFEFGASDCPTTPDIETIVLTASTYNAALNPDAVFDLLPSAAVNAFRCETDTTIQITVDYATGDCDRNGVPDSCDPDCNSNGIPDACDIDPNDPDANGNSSEDCDDNGTPDECQSLADDDGDGVPNICDNCPDNANPDQLDCDNDGVGDLCALLDTATDCNNNGIPDNCDIADCPAEDPTCADCDDNGVPDGCEPDCDLDGVIDACAISECDPNDIACSDCNENGIPDSCDLTSGLELDCNGNNIPDTCEPDCDGDGIPDDCELASGSALDCNNNGIPDNCDISTGTDPDCNGNEIPDSCDVQTGVANDCDMNGVPDLCDITNNVVGDCNGNETPDSCEIADGILNDCDNDGLPDLCAIVLCDPNDPSCADCDLNGIPDTCAVTFISEEVVQQPFGNGFPVTLTLIDPPLASTSIQVQATARAALGSSTQSVDVLLDGASVGTLFRTGAITCPTNPNEDELTLPAATLNDARDPNGLLFEFIADGTIDPNLCDETILTVKVTYATNDCNGNQIPDNCEIAAGDEEDCNGDGIPDSCQPDCDDDGVIDACALLTCPGGDDSCADCNNNAIPDGCESGFTEDCNNNGISDLCDLAAGTSTDLDGNGIPDECDTDVVTFNDLNSNGPRGDATNTVVTHTFAGGAPLGQIDWNGTLTILHPTTFGGEAEIEITHPSGVVRTFQLNPLSQTLSGGPTYAESGTIPQRGAIPAIPFGVGLDPAGTWTFRFYEVVDDGGTAEVDARWDDLTIRLEPNQPTEPTPPTTTDLGPLSGVGTTTVNVTAGEVAWFEFTISEAVAANNATFLELDTQGSAIGASDDTELALYDRWGYLVATNDDADDTLQSRLSHGTGSAPGTGTNGDLFPGTYYLAVAGYNLDPQPDFAANTTSSDSGTLQLNYNTNTTGGNTGLPGDADGDCQVSLTDLAILLNNFGETNMQLADGDFTGDGNVDLSDLALLLTNFGESC